MAATEPNAEQVSRGAARHADLYIPFHDNAKKPSCTGGR